jgi:transcriptional regulator GlxA family with amidase domain
MTTATILDRLPAPSPAPGPNPAAFNVGIVLVPGFSLMSFSCLIEPMRGANRISGTGLYRWTYLAPGGGEVFSSNGLPVPTLGLPPQGQGLDMVVVCGGHADHLYTERRTRDFLRQASRAGIVVGSVSTASFILADAGLLDGRCCTTHWDYIDAFREAYPRLDVRNELFIVDRRVFTCGGGIAAIDIVLDVIGRRQGQDFANRVSENFVHGMPRQAHDSQRMALRDRLGVRDVSLLQAVELMEAHIEAPLRIAAIARSLRMPQRRLERLFDRHLGCTPTHQYVTIRLARARKLLRHTSMSVLEIGLSCGFTSASHFARSYRAHFGMPPSRDRKPPAGESL